MLQFCSKVWITLKYFFSECTYETWKTRSDTSTFILMFASSAPIKLREDGYEIYFSARFTILHKYKRQKNEKSWKKIMKSWKILSTKAPQGIFILHVVIYKVNLATKKLWFKKAIFETSIKEILLNSILSQTQNEP